MPKLKGIFPLRGKMKGKTFVRMPNGETYLRDVAAPGTKKDEPALKQHYVRTPHLNKLASGISNILKVESDTGMHGQFYAQVLKRFRKHSSDHRFLLLSSLKEIDRK